MALRSFFFSHYLVLILCCNISSLSYLSERNLALPLVWPHVLNSYTDILLKEKYHLFFPKEILRVPPFLGRQHAKWVSVPPPHRGGRGGDGGREGGGIITIPNWGSSFS